MNVIKRGRHIVVLAVLLVGLVACATPGPVLTESVGTIRTGIGTAREQSRLAFEAANRIAREQAVERKVDDAKAVSIAESDFPLAVAQADADQWAAAFNALDGYAAALQKLVDPKLSLGTGDALQALSVSSCRMARPSTRNYPAASLECSPPSGRRSFKRAPRRRRPM